MLTSRSGFVLLVIALVGVACHARPPATSPTRTAASPPAPALTAPAPPPAPAPPAPPRPVASPKPLTEDELFQRKSLNELNAEQPLRDAFFDYDQIELRDDAKLALQQDARWLAKWPRTIISVEGHCDERGTAEYNLALGERRAQVVREYLGNLGIRPDRIATRSLGKEAPFCRDAATDSCWSQNRRGHFMITAK